MNIQQWINENIAPNVEAVGDYMQQGASGDIRLFDVSVFITTAQAGVIQRTTQAVYEIADGDFRFGKQIVKNYQDPIEEVSKESKIKQALQNIKAQDPNAKYLGMDSNADLQVVKLKVNDIPMAYTFLEDELIDLPMGA